MGRNTIPSKRRLLEIYTILRRADREHPVSRAAINAELEEKYGAEVSPTSITDDIKTLVAMGLAQTTGSRGVARDDGRGAYGRFEDNFFEPWELKILLDAVTQVPYLNAGDVRRIRNKLLGMTSDSMAQITRQNLTHLPETSYAEDDSFRQTLAVIMDAIYRRRKMTFHYARLDQHKKRELDHKSSRIINPYAVSINDGFFYLLCYADEEGIRNYRLDRIMDPEILDLPSIPASRTPEGDMTQRIEAFVLNNTNNFFGSDTTPVTIRWDHSKAHISVLYDVMGLKNVTLINAQESTYSILSTNNTGLYANLLRLADAATILGPKKIQDHYLAILDNIRSKY